MRYVSLAGAAAALSVLAPFVVRAQAPSLYVTNYQFVNEERVTRTQWYVTYRADLVNNGNPRPGVTATLTSLVQTVSVVPGQGTLHFPAIPTGGQATSIDTFTILVDRTVPFDFASLQWSFLNPVANPGPNQTATMGSTVVLNGGGSTNPSGAGTLTYSWVLKSRPAASHATLTNASSVMASFVVDAPGSYVVMLTVSNGSASDSASVTVSTVNSPPVAKPGPNQTVGIASTVLLNGSASSDVDGDPLTYLWGLVTRPPGSNAQLGNARTVSTSFVADVAGTYIVQLTVNDGSVDSTPATVTITTSNTPPVANAGPNQTMPVGSLVQLNGASSTDVDGNTLTFKWALIAVPSGSNASLSDPAAVNPTFTADKAGTYVAQLVVNDGHVDSIASTVSITTNTVQGPVANAGPSQTVPHGATVTLSGSGTDPQNLPLTMTWSLITRPVGSTAALSATNIAHPTFVADKPGSYVAQLIVSNGLVNSTPSTVTITTTNTPPVANAGASQNVTVGTIVSLDGSNSSDADHDPLSYSWSFTSLPAASTTVLSAANGSKPTFFADVPGTYVVQLIVNDGFTNSPPATVTITASTLKISLTPNPLNLANAPGTLTVTIGAPAGTGGLLVTFSGYDPSVISLPPSVTVPENSTGANVAVTPLGPGNTNILATAPGFQPGTTAVNVSTPTVAVNLGVPAVGNGRSITGTITLSAPAPPNGALVSISSTPTGIVTLSPTDVPIAAGATTGTFTLTGAAEGSTTVRALASGYIGGQADILVVKLGGISLPTNLTVPPGNTVPLNVTLSTPAPVGGATVSFSSSDSSILTVSPSAFIAQGATSPATPPTVTGVKFGSATVTASSPGYVGDVQTVKVAATLSFSAQAVTVGAGGVKTIDLLLSAPAPAGGLIVNLNSSNPNAVTVPSSVTIPANSTSVPVQFNGLAQGSATVTATATASNIAGASVAVTVGVSGSITLPSNVSVGVGKSVPFPVALSAAAPQDVVITLATSRAATVDISPKTVTVAAGQTQPASQPQVIGVSLGSVTISATAPGFGTSTQTVQATSSLSFTPSSLTIGGSGTNNLTLTLSSPAPAGGLVVNLSATPTGVVTIPGSVTIAENTTTATVAVTGATPGTATISANAAAPYVTATTASVTVQGAGNISLPSTVSIGPGASAPFAVTLSTPAPQGGLTVNLSSSDSTVLTISPASVTISQGQTQPSTQPQINGLKLGTVTVNATGLGYTPASVTVKVASTLVFTPTALTLIGPDTKALTLSLSSASPTATTVNLSASPAGIVTVPSSVTVPASGSVDIAVKGAGLGSTTITASSSAPNVANATAAVSTQTAGALTLPSNVSVNVGQSTAFAVALPSPAPPGGVTVNLSSSDTSKVTVSPSSVTIAAGDTQPATAPQVTGKGLGSATVTASAALYTSTSKTVQVNGTISFSPASLSLGVGQTQSLTLTLSGAAPAGGLTFSVSSNKTSVATVSSATYAIPANSTTVTVPVTGVAIGSAQIRATAANFADATADVTVGTGGDVVVPATLTVAPGDSVAYPITLGKSAPSQLFIDLTSSDDTKATVSPSHIAINQGQTQSATPVRVYGVAAGAVTITAKPSTNTLAPGITSVTVGYSLTISPQTLTIMGSGSQGLLTLSLSAPAPSGGIQFSLSSSNTGVATVPSTFPFSAGTTTASVRVMSSGPGTAVISVSAPGIPGATATVNVVPPGAITMTMPASIALNQTANISLSLSAPAPAGGVTLELTTSDPTHVNTSVSSVTIPAGSTSPSVAPQIIGVNVGGATITASAPGYTAPSPVVVQVSTTVTWVTQNAKIVGIGKQAQLVLRLNTTAPTSGLKVDLKSSDPTVATIQPTGIFIWDGSSAPGITIPVNSAGLGTTVIHASGVNIPDVTTTVTVVAPVSITTTALPAGNAGAPYSATAAATGGTPPYTWVAAGLPAGLSMNGATGVISGTPTQSGTVQVTLTVTDSTNPAGTASKTLPLTISSGPAITTASLPDGVNGSAYTATLAATGGRTPYSWSASGLPGGLSINSATGQIGGTPTATGTSTVTFTVTDSSSPAHLTSTKTLTLNIVAPLALTVGSLPAGVVGTSYSVQIGVTGGTPPYTIAVSGLPPGLTFNTSTGVISGTPTAIFNGNVTINATDSSHPPQSISKTLSLVITNVLTITTAALPNGTVNAPYNASVAAAGGVTPYTWSASGLPGGLSINSSTGAISGTATAAFSGNVVITVTDSAAPTHQTVSKTLALAIQSQLSISTAALPDGIAGTLYNFTASSIGGVAPYSWSATGLPAGLTMDAAGRIAGTPTAAGTANVTITVTDTSIPTRQSASKTLPLKVLPSLSITTIFLPPGAVGTPYSAQVMAAGGTTPYTWSATGLPPTLSISSTTGQITGTPTAAFSGNVNVTVTDSTSPAHLTTSKAFALSIGAALTITTTSLPNGIVGKPYSAQAAAAGGATPYSWSASGLPPGLSIDSSTGTISGTAASVSSGNVVLTATDSTNPTHVSVSKTLPLAIVAQLSISTTSLPDGVVGAAYSQTASAVGGATPYSWSASGLPAGLAIDSAGHITGSPTAGGSFNVTLTVTDATAPTRQTASKAVPLKISQTLSITTASLPDGVVGVSYSGPVTATGGTTPYSWSATGLPAGLGINSTTGVISGSPTVAFTGNVTITVADSTAPTHLNVSKTLALSIRQGLAITTGSLPDAISGTSYNGTVSAAGGTSPYSWLAQGLPAGLSINSTTGQITGTTSAVGTANVVVTVTDSTSPTHLSISKTLALRVVPVLSISTTALPDAVVGTAYSFTAAGSGGAAPYVWSQNGLPSGLTINASTGVISGTPSTAGTTTVTLILTDATNPTHQTTARNLQLRVTPTLSITTTALPNGVAGKTYTAQLSATGGTLPYKWTAAGLPAGLTIAPATGQITGTPTSVATANVTITVTDSSNPAVSASQTLAMKIVAALSISTTTLPDGVAGKPYSGQVSAIGGSTPYSWSATGLPNGLAISPTTGQITGTPAATGTSTVTVTATDSTNPTHQAVNKQLTLVVWTALSITTPALPDGIVGRAYTGAVTAAGGATPYSWSATGLPAGLTLNPATGQISGTPSTAGTATVTVAVTDATNPTHQSVSTQFSLLIRDVLSITTASLPNGIAGAAYSTAAGAAGGTPPYSWSATNLPAGLSINPGTGQISGTAASTGTSNVTLTVTDSTSPTHLTVSKTLPLTVVPALILTTSTLANAVAGKPYSASLTASGGVTPYSWSAANLPAGLSINGGTGQISGTPTAAGSNTVTVTVTDLTSPTHQSVSKQLSLVVRNPLTVTTTSLPDAIVNAGYTAPLTATGGATPYVWSAAGLPTTLTINPATGQITGTPTVVATYSITVTVTDASTPAQATTATLPLAVVPPPLGITTAALANGTVGVPYSNPALAATGGTPPYGWTASGLPAGLTLGPSTGLITGTPTTAGRYSVTITATDTSNPRKTAQVTLAMVVQPTALVITTASLPNGRVGVAYDQVVVATGGTPSYSWSASGLPGGLSINATTGHITGTPTAASTNSVTVTVTDAGNPSQTKSKSLSLTIDPGALTITTTALPAGQVGTPYSFTPTFTGGLAPFTWTITPLPRGLTYNPSTGQISGTPSAPGTATVGLTLKDSSTPTPQTAAKTLPLAILNPPLAISTTSPLPNAIAGSPYSQQIVASGGLTPYSWSATGLPAGLTINSQTGVISGTATAMNNYTPTITVSDNSVPTQTVSKVFALAVGSTAATGKITVTSATVGENLQDKITITFDPAPTVSTSATIKSGDGSLVVLGFAADSGTPTVSATISPDPTPGATKSVSIFVKALSSIGGPVTITVSAPGYKDGTGTVTLAKSGFVLIGPAGMGGSFSTYQGVSTTLTVSAARLNANGTYADTQQIRGAYSTTVTLGNSNPTVGSLTSTSLNFGGGTDSVNVQFKAANPPNSGVTTISASAPLPFITPASGGSIIATVQQGGVIPFNVTVGKNLEVLANASINGKAGAAGVPVTITSSDPSKVKFALSSVAAGQTSISLTIPPNQNVTPDFWVQAFDSSGTVSYTIDAGPFGSVTSTVALAPSGIILSTPAGPNASFTMALGVVDATLTIYTVQQSGGTVEYQDLVPGQSISVTVTSSNTVVGTITSSPVTITGGTGSVSTAFHSLATGSSTITAKTTAYGTVSAVASVSQSKLAIFPATVGQHLQVSGTLLLTAPAPPGGLDVTLSSSSSLLKLSSSATTAGVDTLNIHLNANESSATYYMQAIGSSGTVLLTAAATGYAQATASVTMLSSSVIMLPVRNSASAGGPDVTVVVELVPLDANGVALFNSPQALAGGPDLAVTLTSSNPNIGTIASVTFPAGGVPTQYTAFKPLAAGQTTISVQEPAGWSTPSSAAPWGTSFAMLVQ